MKYHHNYVSLTHDQLKAKVQEQMSEKRYHHVLGVEQSAIALAKHYGADVEKASIAALTHDYAKERSDEEFLDIIAVSEYPADLQQWGNPIWHGIVGADIVRRELKIHDTEILEAIRLHTTGAADMSLLDKIIYVADYIEPGRNFPGVEEARELAFSNLDAAVAYETQHTLAFLLKKKAPVYPKTIETYNKWVAQKHS